MDTGTTRPVLTDVREQPLYAMWWLAAVCGLRRGELLGLRWVDIDLTAATLTVNQQLVCVHGAVLIAEPKTPAAQRVLALDSTTVAELRAHQLAQQCQATMIGSHWDDSGYLFTPHDGRPLRPDRVTHHFHHLITALRLPPIRLHDLRHGAATMALAAHADVKTVQHMLGHTSYAFTADTYGTVLPDTSYAAAEATALLILRAMREGT